MHEVAYKGRLVPFHPSWKNLVPFGSRTCSPSRAVGHDYPPWPIDSNGVLVWFQMRSDTVRWIYHKATVSRNKASRMSLASILQPCRTIVMSTRRDMLNSMDLTRSSSRSKVSIQSSIRIAKWGSVTLRQPRKTKDVLPHSLRLVLHIGQD